MTKTKTPWVDYKTLKSNIPILTVLQNFGIELPSQNGDQLYGSCPLPCHAGDGDNQHAFSVNTEKNCYRCITHCGGGNVLDLYAHLSNRDPSDKAVFREVALEMQTRYLGNDSPTHQRMSAPAKTSTSKVDISENKPLTIRPLQVKSDIPYLFEEKKLPLEILEEFGIGFCSRGMFSGRIVLPLHDKHGNCVAYAGRGMKEADISKRGRWLLPKGFSKSLELFNQHRAIQQDIDQFGLVVVEGFWSCIRFHLAGIPAVALMGSELSDTQLERISEITDRVWLMLDRDTAGLKAEEKILPRLTDRVHVRRVQYPDDVDHQQPEDFTPDELKSLIPV